MKNVIKEVKSKRIFIIGEKNIHNDFLSYLIERELDLKASIHKDLNTIKIFQPLKSFISNDQIYILIMIDCLSYSFEEILKDISQHRQHNKTNSQIALFNLNMNTGVEKKALSRDIKGFFYKDDKIELFLKGIKCLFNKEIWISRDILFNCALDGFESRKIVIKKSTTLTQREIEILSMVSMGAKNEEIADKMFISPNTVKTHLYNIFRKIKVYNRMQAALWAAKNL